MLTEIEIEIKYIILTETIGFIWICTSVYKIILFIYVNS